MIGPVMVLVGIALAATWSPLGLLLWAPLLLGVPHVAADVRWLVLEPRWPLAEGLVRWMAGVAVVLLGLRLLTMVGATVPTTWELAVGLCGVALAVRAAPGAPAWLWAALVVAAGLAWWSPGGFALAVGHLHNGVALLLWAWTGAAMAWAVAGMVAAMVGAILFGLMDGVAWGPVGGLSLEAMAATLAPGLPSVWAARVVLSFAVLQAVHYAVWVVWMSPRAGGWRRALGGVGWWAVVLAAVVVPTAALLDPTGVRSAYLGIVLFHGWIELMVVAHLVARGGDGAG